MCRKRSFVEMLASARSSETGLAERGLGLTSGAGCAPDNQTDEPRSRAQPSRETFGKDIIRRLIATQSKLTGNRSAAKGKFVQSGLLSLTIRLKWGAHGPRV